jgi:hypothetical protein
MKSLLRSVLFAAVTLALVTGCVSTGLYETARTAPPGQIQGGLTLEPFFLGSGVTSLAALYSMLGVQLKLGVVPGFDIGLTLGGTGYMGLNGKYQFLSGPMDGALHCSGAFFGIADGGEGGGYYTLTPRAVFSSETPGRVPYSFHLGANYTGIFGAGNGQTEVGGVLYVLGGVGMPVRVGTHRELRVMPELSFGKTVFSNASSGGFEALERVEGGILKLGINIAYVGRDTLQGR